MILFRQISLRFYSAKMRFFRSRNMCLTVISLSILRFRALILRTLYIYRLLRRSFPNHSHANITVCIISIGVIIIIIIINVIIIICISYVTFTGLLCLCTIKNFETAFVCLSHGCQGIITSFLVFSKFICILR